MADALLDAMFQKIDQNGDGIITKDELDAIFSRFDTDNDGTVSKDEFIAAFTSKLGGSAEQAGKVFAKLDKDGSGDIGVGETSALYWEMDTDQNGQVSKEEFVARWKQLLA